ncbi:DnaJ domain-containing protein [Candidatus Vidania fulgoroideorum]
MLEKYYKILGVNENSSPEAIKKAYRRLAMKYHPDRNRNNKRAEEKFKEINEAYKIITNPEEANSQNNFNDFNEFNGFDNIFEDLFGESESQDQIYETNKNNYKKIKINLEDASRGSSLTIKIFRNKICENCNGHGSIIGKNFNMCNSCKGTGFHSKHNSFFNIKQICPNCKGMGKINLTKCYNCTGEGIKKIKDILRVNIPRGVLNKTRLKIDGYGNIYDIKNKKYGDLFLDVYIKKHKYFYIDRDYNVNYNLNVFFLDFLLGKFYLVKTLSGYIKVKIKYSSLKKIKFKNRGIYNLKNKKISDFIINLKIFFPNKINSKQKGFLMNLKNSFEK